MLLCYEMSYSETAEKPIIPSMLEMITAEVSNRVGRCQIDEVDISKAWYIDLTEL